MEQRAEGREQHKRYRILPLRPTSTKILCSLTFDVRCSSFQCSMFIFPCPPRKQLSVMALCPIALLYTPHALRSALCAMRFALCSMPHALRVWTLYLVFGSLKLYRLLCFSLYKSITSCYGSQLILEFCTIQVKSAPRGFLFVRYVMSECLRETTQIPTPNGIHPLFSDQVNPTVSCKGDFSR